MDTTRAEWFPAITRSEMRSARNPWPESSRSTISAREKPSAGSEAGESVISMAAGWRTASAAAIHTSPTAPATMQAPPARIHFVLLSASRQPESTRCGFYTGIRWSEEHNRLNGTMREWSEDTERHKTQRAQGILLSICSPSSLGWRALAGNKSVEQRHVLRSADRKRAPVVHGARPHLRHARAQARSGAPGLLRHKPQRRAFVHQAQLALLVRGIGRVEVDAALQQNAVHVAH